MGEESKCTNLKQIRKAESRERILQEAAAAVRLEGADRVSVATIMGRAGMTVGGFYAHFASKEDLLAAAVRHMFDDRYKAFLDTVGDSDAASTLSRFVDSYLSMRHRDSIERGCPIPALAGEIGRLAQPVRDEFTRGIESLEEAVHQLLERTGHPDAGSLASSLVAEMTGAVSLARAQPDAARAEGMLAASRAMVRQRIGL